MTSIVESKTIECNEGRNCSTNFKVNRNNASYNIVIARNDVAGGSFYTSDSLGKLVVLQVDKMHHVNDIE